VELPEEGNGYGLAAGARAKLCKEGPVFNSEKRSIKNNEKDLGKEAAYANYRNYE
jgi:hypothetical protein